VVVPGGGAVVPGGGVVVGIAELAAAPEPPAPNALTIAGIPSKAAAAIGSIFLKASKILEKLNPPGALNETSPIVEASISSGDSREEVTVATPVFWDGFNSHSILSDITLSLPETLGIC
jgi:hypothetical protein